MVLEEVGEVAATDVVKGLGSRQYFDIYSVSDCEPEKIMEETA